MRTSYTVDTSVFVSAVKPEEKDHEDSARLLARLWELRSRVVVPALLLPEVGGALARGVGDPALAEQVVSMLSELGQLELVSLDRSLAGNAAALAVQCRLKGADAVYVAVALRFGTAVITLDDEQRERVPPGVTALSPSQALTHLVSDWRET